MSRRILITGASVAGSTAAWWLSRFGFDVTVVELAPEFRDGGQNIDVRGVGREVLRRMNLEQAALDHGTGEEGTAWVNERGNHSAEFIASDIDGDGPTAEMEILRGDLARILFEPARARSEFRFGDRVERIDDGPDGVEVTFKSGRTEHFDCVILAEGVGSTTRDQVFPGENQPRWMDMTVAFFTIPRTPDDDQLWRIYNTTRGRTVSLRPDNHGTIRATLQIQRESGGEHEWNASRQKAWLREQFAEAGWEATRILNAMDDTDDFYFDVLRQVQMKRWSNGRIVLTGDAAWCPTPIAGLGTTLALTGAYVLSSELQRTDDLSAAFAAYEHVMRPMVEDAQGVPKIAPRLMNPQSRSAIHLLHGALNLASKPAVQNFTGKLFNRDPSIPDLSRYPTVAQ